MDIFESLVSKIEAANEYYSSNQTAIHDDLYHRQKFTSNNHVYHNNSGEQKAKKIAERELRRPWVRLGVNYKTMVVLSFLREFRERHPDVNINQIMYDMMMLLSQGRTEQIKVDYDSNNGRIRTLNGYELVNNRIVPSTNPEAYLSNKILIRLRLKTAEEDSACSEIQE